MMISIVVTATMSLILVGVKCEILFDVSNNSPSSCVIVVYPTRQTINAGIIMVGRM